MIQMKSVGFWKVDAVRVCSTAHWCCYVPKSFFVLLCAGQILTDKLNWIVILSTFKTFQYCQLIARHHSRVSFRRTSTFSWTTFLIFLEKSLRVWLSRTENGWTTISSKYWTKWTSTMRLEVWSPACPLTVTTPVAGKKLGQHCKRQRTWQVERFTLRQAIMGKSNKSFYFKWSTYFETLQLIQVWVKTAALYNVKLLERHWCTIREEQHCCNPM